MDKVISQASFVFEHERQLPAIVGILRDRLRNAYFSISHSNGGKRLFVASDDGERQTYDECRGISARTLLDDTTEVFHPSQLDFKH